MFRKFNTCLCRRKATREKAIEEVLSKFIRQIALVIGYSVIAATIYYIIMSLLIAVPIMWIVVTLVFIVGFTCGLSTSFLLV